MTDLSKKLLGIDDGNQFITAEHLGSDFYICILNYKRTTPECEFLMCNRFGLAYRHENGKSINIDLPLNLKPFDICENNKEGYCYFCYGKLQAIRPDFLILFNEAVKSLKLLWSENTGSILDLADLQYRHEIPTSLFQFKYALYTPTSVMPCTAEDALYHLTSGRKYGSSEVIAHVNIYGVIYTFIVKVAQYDLVMSTNFVFFQIGNSNIEPRALQLMNESNALTPNDYFEISTSLKSTYKTSTLLKGYVVSKELLQLVNTGIESMLIPNSIGVNSQEKYSIFRQFI